jgi:S1-C subfamily serine protease
VDFDALARATLQIECGSSRGSAFVFLRPDTVLTNHHVIEPNLRAGSEIVGQGDGQSTRFEVLAHSDKSDLDFAVLRAKTPFHPPTALHASNGGRPKRGNEVIFAGYPHGIPDLLVQGAIVAGSYADLGFYIDGSVNGGNSGGPIVDRADGGVVGIVTQRRYLGGDELGAIGEEARLLKAHTDAVRGRGAVVIMGINVGEFAALTGRSLDLLEQVIAANANTGLGIGFHIEFALDSIRKLGLI